MAITSTDPASNANQVPRDKKISIQFDAPLLVSSVSETSVQLLDSANGLINSTREISSDGQTVTLDPNAPLVLGENYELMITQTVADVDGNTLADAASINFTTDAGEWAESPVVIAEELMRPNRIDTLISREGHFWALYSDRRGDKVEATRITPNESISQLLEANVPTSSNPVLFQTSNGDLTSIWPTIRNGVIRASYSKYQRAGEQWGPNSPATVVFDTPRTLAARGGADGTAIVLAEQTYTDIETNLVVPSYEGDPAGFSYSGSLPDGPEEFSQYVSRDVDDFEIAIEDTGNATVAWIDNEEGALFTTYFTADTESWSLAERLDTETTAPVNSVDMVTYDGTTRIVWDESGVTDAIFTNAHDGDGVWNDREELRRTDVGTSLIGSTVTTKQNGLAIGWREYSFDLGFEVICVSDYNPASGLEAPQEAYRDGNVNLAANIKALTEAADGSLYAVINATIIAGPTREPRILLAERQDGQWLPHQTLPAPEERTAIFVDFETHPSGQKMLTWLIEAGNPTPNKLEALLYQ